MQLLAGLTGGLSVVLVDERFTSAIAEARLQHKSEREREEAVHAESACSILEAFFENEGDCESEF